MTVSEWVKKCMDFVVDRLLGPEVDQRVHGIL